MFAAAIFEPLIDLSNDRQIVLLDLSAGERQPRPVKFANQRFEYAASVGLDVIAGQIIVAEIAAEYCSSVRPPGCTVARLFGG